MNRYRLLLTVDLGVYPINGPGPWNVEAEVLRVGETPEGPLPAEVEARLLDAVEMAVRQYRAKGLE